MTAPRATIRLQFHRGFTFADAAGLAGYFAKLGVSHIYSSPIMTARPGSTHGYDVIDPSRINPELGSEDGFRHLVAELRRLGLGLILDIVPNHTAVGSGNPWWMDVLAQGRASRYAKYFDIDWTPPYAYLRNKVLLPILGQPYGEVLEAGEISVGFDNGQAIVRYFDHILPIAVGEPKVAATPGDFDATTSHGRTRLHALLEQQHYRLAWWRTANDEINWRRFFDINELAALRIEDDEVFEAVHGRVLNLYAEGLIDGVRVDHIDGFSQPENYCQKLRQRLGALERERPPNLPAGPAYVVVEKILARSESLPTVWQTDGTTGYDFMDQISALLHHDAGERPLREFWQRVSSRPGNFAVEEELARRQILDRSFSAQRDALIAALHAIALNDLKSRDYTRAALRRAVTEILAHFPVYRTYARVGHASTFDAAFLAQAVDHAGKTCLPADRTLVARLGAWLSGEPAHPGIDDLQNVALARFQQLSAPLCAKAVEDTAFYRYGRLISRNDVGFDARQFALPVNEFHRKIMSRAADFPHALLATATHDHKRGEDVRARLAVLSEISLEWTQAVERWIGLSASQSDAVGHDLTPSSGDLAILFQIIVGAWPLGLTLDDRPALSAYSKRIAAWQQKALREAKLHSDWSAPNQTYERAMRDFIAWLFSGSSEVLVDLAAFAGRISPAGAANGLAQTLVKLTAPGIPDIYQGTDYWDLSLVDPDNRAPVDFAVRQQTLVPSDIEKLTARWRDGAIKQFVISRILAARKEDPDLFAKGTYVPLQPMGPKANHLVAFARCWRNSTALVMFARFTAKLPANKLELPVLHCANTRIQIPSELSGLYCNALTTEPALSVKSQVQSTEIFGSLPVAFLVKR